MPPRKPPRPTRKRRTREHVIADLGVHHVEGHILRVGFTAERVLHDYSVDLYMTTYTDQGEVENDFVLWQLKATDHLKLRADKKAVVFRIERTDLMRWLGETYPVILVVYDAQADVGYWLSIQAHFAGQTRRISTKQFHTVHLSVVNVVNQDAIRRFAEAKAAIQAQMKGVKHRE
jgi:hypothetical protein